MKMELRKIQDNTYAVVNISDMSSIKFSEVLQDNPSTCRLSLDKKYFIIQFEKIPSFISNGRVKPVAVLSHEEATILMDSEE